MISRIQGRALLEISTLSRRGGSREDRLRRIIHVAEQALAEKSTPPSVHRHTEPLPSDPDPREERSGYDRMQRSGETREED